MPQVAIRLPFNEARLTQAAACFLDLAGRQMNYMKLIKLLYIADREALLNFGFPITTDCYVSMDRGPVLSRALDLINSGEMPNNQEIWFEYISSPKNYDVSLLKDCVKDELSPSDEDIINETWRRYGGMNQWELVNFVHTLPEWRNPQGSAIPIEYSDILKAEGYDDSEISGIIEELSHFVFMNKFSCEN